MKIGQYSAIFAAFLQISPLTALALDRPDIPPVPDSIIVRRIEPELSPQQKILQRRIQHAAEIYRNLTVSMDGGIPEIIIESTRCIVIVPGMIKAAFLFGGKWGQGVATCRLGKGGWSPPAFYSISSASFGFQFGAQQTDLVLFFMDKEARSLSDRSFTLGGDVSVAAGPLGRSAGLSTDGKLHGVYSYARSQGLFAGISLEGALLLSSPAENQDLYRKPFSASDILFSGKVKAPFTGVGVLQRELPGRYWKGE